MQVKATLIAQVNMQNESENAFSRQLTLGVLKATLKNGVIEFFSNWQSHLDK